MKAAAQIVWLFAFAFLADGSQAANSKERVREFAKLPDWSGMWENALPMKDVKFEPTPFTKEWQVKADAARASQSIRYYCAEGMPLMMEVPAQINMFEAFVAPDSVFFNFSTHEVRHIYTDGRPHPAPRDLLRTPVGDSTGHWEGETLVIDTVGTRLEMQSVELVEFHKDHPEPAAIKSVPMSDQLRFVERIRLIDHDHLEDKLTIYDPVALAKPVEEIHHYQRVKDIDRMIYDDCVENERNPIVNGRVTTVEHPANPQK
jgi:hypothetical protein